MDRIEPRTLEWNDIRLEPIGEAWRDALAACAAGQAESFAYWPMDLSDPAAFDRWWQMTLTADDGLQERSFVVLKGEELVGTTRYLSIALPHKRLEIGFTWYHPDHWASTVNPACKYLLMRDAFEVLDMNRVELKTDARNARSRGAMAKFGAKEEGTLRRHRVLADGYVRDTVYFSVIAEEWPSVREGLLRRIGG